MLLKNTEWQYYLSLSTFHYYLQTRIYFQENNANYSVIADKNFGDCQACSRRWALVCVCVCVSVSEMVKTESLKHLKRNDTAVWLTTAAPAN